MQLVDFPVGALDVIIGAQEGVKITSTLHRLVRIRVRFSLLASSRSTTRTQACQSFAYGSGRSLRNWVSLTARARCRIAHPRSSARLARTDQGARGRKTLQPTSQSHGRPRHTRSYSPGLDDVKHPVWNRVLFEAGQSGVWTQTGGVRP